MKKFAVFYVLIVFLAGIAKGQERTVSGQVTGADDGLSLPGVSIIVKGSTIGTTTDIDGRYELRVPGEESVLIFKFVGFATQEVKVGSRNIINVSLRAEATRLEEVVVTALGIKREKREIGYSSETINSDDILRAGTPNVIGALAGRSAGVQISFGDGVEGGSTRITIRGNNNLSRENQPLIVVDGIPMDNTSGLDNIGRGVDWGNGIADINPYDIETYSVLKGGAASALYGERGANGVILITTKRGSRQKGLGVTYNHSSKFTNPYRYRAVQNKYGHGGPISLSAPTFPVDDEGNLLYPGIYGNENLILDQNGTTSSTSAQFGYYGSAVSWGPEMNGQMVKWWDGKIRSYSPQPDNMKMPFQNGLTQTHNISVQGGNDKGSIRLSLTNEDNTPTIKNSNFQRNTINFGTNIKVSDKLTADATLSYVKFKRLNSPMIGEDGNSFSKGFLYSWPRSYQGVDMQNYMMEDGSRNPQDGYPFMYVDRYIWWNYNNNNTWQDRDKYTGLISLVYDVTPWLQAIGKAGRDFSLEQFTSKNKPIDFIGLQGGGYGNSLRKTNNDIFEALLIANKKKLFNSDFDVAFTLGASRWDHNIYGISGNSGTWYYPNMYTFFNYTENAYQVDWDNNISVVDFGDAVKNLIPKEYIRRQRTNSVLSFLNLSYKSFVFLELTGRNDWSSTLPSYNNSYFYPSASLSFIASEAFKFEERLPWLNFLKIRGGLAQIANPASSYEKDFYYQTDIFGGDQASSLPEAIPPFELKPQRVNSYEAGVNMGMFDNRIDVDFTMYYLYSFDQILQLPLPVSSGANNIWINRGELYNRGFEISLNTVPVHRPNFLVKAGINFTRNRNYILSLGGHAGSYLLADIWGLNGPAMELYEGSEYGTITGYDYVYHANGKPILNEEGTHYKITDTRVPIGNASPDFLAAFNTEIRYKNFSVGALIDTKWGGDIYCGSYVIGLQTGQSPETLLERDGGGLPYTDPTGVTSNIGVILDGVYEDGTPNDKVVHYYYKYLPNAGGWGKFLSTPGIIENTWVKMREVSLSYTIPAGFLTKTRVFNNLTLSLVGRDLFYIYTTLPDNINPEGIMGSGNAQGFEWASFPGTRSFSLSVSASF